MNRAADPSSFGKAETPRGTRSGEEQGASLTPADYDPPDYWEGLTDEGMDAMTDNLLRDASTGEVQEGPQSKKA